MFLHADPPSLQLIVLLNNVMYMQTYRGKINILEAKVNVPALDGAPFPLATPTYTRILMVSEISTCRLLVPKSWAGHVVTPEQTQEHKVHCTTKSTTALSVSTGKKEYRGRSRGEDQGQVE